MKKNRIWIIGIVLTATAGFIALQNLTAPAVDEVLPTPFITNTSAIIFTDTPTPTPAYEGCGFMWAYHNAPDLTEKINTAVRNLYPDASARAEFFGEDCVFADGSAKFSAMETDFYVQLPVDNLTDEETFGNWMAQVLPLIVQTPEEEIQGNYGFVEFSFIKSEAERIIFRVPIVTYVAEAKEKSGAELFRFFHTPPVNST
jgi:hypothetical protein